MVHLANSWRNYYLFNDKIWYIYINEFHFVYQEIIFLALNIFSAINNCMDAFPTSGIVKVRNHGLDLFPVYCDQTNDEGGD